MFRNQIWDYARKPFKVRCVDGADHWDSENASAAVHAGGDTRRLPLHHTVDFKAFVPSKYRALRDQICTTYGFKVNSVMQVDERVVLHHVVGQWTEIIVVLPTVLRTVGRRGPRTVLFVGALRPTKAIP